MPKDLVDSAPVIEIKSDKLADHNALYQKRIQFKRDEIGHAQQVEPENGKIIFSQTQSRELLGLDGCDPDQYHSIREVIRTYAKVHTFPDRVEIVQINPEKFLADYAVIKKGVNLQPLRDFLHILSNELGQDENVNLLDGLDDPSSREFISPETNSLVRSFVYDTDDFYHKNAETALSMTKNKALTQVGKIDSLGTGLALDTIRKNSTMTRFISTV